MSNNAAASSSTGGNNPPDAAPAVPPAPVVLPRSTQTRYEVPMLEDSEGYAHWQYCMTLVLEDSDLMGVIDGTYAKPSATLDAAGYADWVHRDRRC